MKWNVYADQLADARIKTLVFAGLSIFLALALVTNGLFRGATVVHVVPVEIDKPYWASAATASPEYFTKMALSLVPYVANLHPASVELQHKSFLGYVAPEAAGRITEQLAGDRAYVMDHQLSRVFYPMQTQVVKDEVTLIGTEKRYIGATLVVDGESRFYRLKLRQRDWKVEVLNLEAGVPDTTGQAPAPKAEHVAAKGTN